MTCTVSGPIKDFSGDALPNVEVVFKPVPGVVGLDGATRVPRLVRATTSAGGTITVDLEPGAYIGTVLGIDRALSFRVGVPDAASADLHDLINQAPPVTPSVLSATVAAKNAAEAAAASAEADAIATAADRVQTGLDVTAADNSADAAAASETAAGLSETAAAASAAQAALFDGPWLDDVDALLADTALTYTGGSPSSVTTGDYVRTRAEGFSYEVAASGASDQHVTTAGGVKLYVLPDADGFASIQAFGATGLAADNQDAAAVAADASGLPIKIPVNFIVKYSTPLVLSAAWLGGGTGDGNPGSATDTNTAFRKSELRFTGTGWAVTTPCEFGNLALRADATVTGQSGLRLTGPEGQQVHPVRIMDFDDVGCELGDNDGTGRIYFSQANSIRLNNRARVGSVGLRVLGGMVASSNGNILTGVFVSGAWARYVHIIGHANIFVGGDVQPEQTLVEGLGGAITEAVYIEGDGNTWLNPYIEPSGAANTAVLVRFASGSTGNRLERIYTPSSGSSIFARVVDLGAENDLSFVFIGENFTPSVGRATSERNLIPNPGFVNVSSGTPVGWIVGGGTTGTVAVDTSVTRGGKRTLKLTTSATRAQLDCYVASTSSLATRGAVSFTPPAALRGQTITVGAWCLSSVAGVGAVSVLNNAVTLAGGEHSGSGNWEFLTARTRVEDAAADVAIRLRSNQSFANTTGECWFSEPVVFIGNDASRFLGVKALESEDAALMGRMTWNPVQPLTVDSATPSVLEGNLFTEANTVATTITNFTDGRNGQEIKIIVTSANTTLGNGTNIQTTTGANKALSANRVYSLVFNGTKWFELG